MKRLIWIIALLFSMVAARGLYFKGVKRSITKITTTGPIYIETLIATSDSDAENTNNWSCDMLFEHKLDK